MDLLSFNTVEKIDFDFLFIIGISFLILLFITSSIIYFLVKYRKRKNRGSSHIEGNVLLKIIWTAVPIIIVLFMFYFNWSGIKALLSVPEGALKVEVRARMWSWLFEYENAKKSSKLYVPVGKPVLLELTSEDVIYNFYAPAFKIKIDIVPGMKTYAWFKPESIREYDIFCAKYCDRGHANMHSKIIVQDEKQFYAWLKEGGEHVAEGHALFENYGCSSCHSVNGDTLVGPNLMDIIGKVTIIISDGEAIKKVVDEDYFRDSVLFPEKEIVKGFDSVMPSYDGQISEEELDRIIEYLGGEGEEKKEAEGREIAEREGCFSCHSTDGSVNVGPSFKELFHSKIKVKRGKTIKTKTVDEDYIIDSIINPSEYIVDGFDDIMPPYKNLTDDEIKKLLDYIKSLSE